MNWKHTTKNFNPIVTKYFFPYLERGLHELGHKPIFPVSSALL